MNNDLFNENKKEFSNSFNFDPFEIRKRKSNSKDKTIISDDSNIKNNKNRNYLNDYYSHEENKNINRAENIITVNDIFSEDKKRKINIDIMDVPFDNFFPGKVSIKSYGPIKAYAANTNQGISRDYNEDRVSIIINVNRNISEKCKEKKEWPKVSYFSIFDGHGGNKCADFLKNNLLSLICENKYYPHNIEKAIKYGFKEADKIFFKLIQIDGEITDNSGSCGLILLVFETKIYVANVGDSRCVISLNNGQTRKDVTRDHKPNYPYEKERIILNGGKIYQTQTNLNQNEENNEFIDNEEITNIENNTNLILIGPYRVSPGNLSVSRTIGDPYAKLTNFGGNPKVVISEPDIYCFDLNKDDIDFLILGCDGIYDQITSKEILQCAWMMIEKNKKIMDANDNIDIYNTCANIVDFILKMSMARKSFDNVTCLIVAFKDLLKNDDIGCKDNIIKFIKKEEDNNKNKDILRKKLPNLSKNKTLSGIDYNDNHDNSKNKFHIDINKNFLNIKNLKIYNLGESRNINCLNPEEISHIIRNNISKNKESKISEYEKDDFLKYKHKLAFSLKKAKQTKKYELENNNNINNFMIGKNKNSFSIKKPKLNLEKANKILNNKIKPIIIENKFLLNNSDKFKSNLALKKNSFSIYSDKNHMKTENLYKKPNSNKINCIQNYNFKEKNNLFYNKPKSINLNIINNKNKDKLSLNELISLEQENKTNKNIRLKTLNKKSISFYNNVVDDLINNKKKIHNKFSVQKNNNKNKYELFRMNPINGRNTFAELPKQKTYNLKENQILNLFHINKDEKNKLIFKPGLKGKYLMHNLTEDFLADNKGIEISNINNLK